MDKKALEAYAKHSKDNEIEILQSKDAACLFCRSHFSARDIKDWHSEEEGVTAICPECGMASVIGDASELDITHDRLREVNKALYDDKYMKNNPEAIDKYLDRYESGEITRKKANDALYLHYLEMRADMGDADCCFRLATEMMIPNEFHFTDFEKAAKYFSSDALLTDPAAHVHLGYIYLHGLIKGPANYKKAFECFSKAMALGSKMAALFISDMYLYGFGVKKDVEFAYSIIESLYSDAYSSFYVSKGAYYGIFGHLCYRLANMYRYGLAMEKNPDAALRFYLLADLAFRYEELDDKECYSIFGEFGATLLSIDDLASEEGFGRAEPVYDFRTYEDSAEPDGEEALAILRGKSTFMNPTYDNESKTFSVEIGNGRLPFIIIDIESVFSDFVEGPIRWDFEHVSSAKFTKATHFDFVEWRPLELRFYAYGQQGEPEIVCELKFEEEPPIPSKAEKKRGSAA